MSGFHLVSLTPTVASLTGGLLGTLVGARTLTLRQLAWGALAAITAGGIASAALSSEYLGSGTTGGAAIAALGGLVGAAVCGWILRDRPGPKKATQRSRAAATAEPGTSGWLMRVGTCLILGVAAVAAAAAGLALAATVVLLLLAAVSLTKRGWPLSTALFTVAIVVSASEVVAGNLFLSRIDQVGQPTATVAVAAVTLAPLCIHVTSRSTWREALRRVGLVDAAAMAVAVASYHNWLSLYKGLTESQTIAQLQRLGEDNASHMMMLISTTASKTSLGHSAKSLEINPAFAGYFPGGSIWQASVGALLPGQSDPRLYVQSTAVLLALLAGCATSVAALVKTRIGGLTALAVVVVGVIGSRATMAMYEIGFPGQLLVACFSVGALALVLVERRVRRGSWVAVVALGLIALATWWTWNLAAPILCLPLAVLAYQHLRAYLPLPAQIFRVALAAGAALFVLGVVLKHQAITDKLDALSLEGGVFRAIPFWLTFGLGLGLPVAYRVAHRREPAAALALVLGSSAATLLLMLWQLTRTSTVTYYTYKLEYLALAVGWATGAFAIAMVVKRLEDPWRLGYRIAAAALALVCLPMLLGWPARSYHDWLVAREVAGPSPVTTCAIDVAHASAGAIFIATGFGKPLANYLTTRAMDVGARDNASSPFWTPILYDGPSGWPWARATRPIVLVQGPVAKQQDTQAMVAAAAAKGVTVTVATRQCPASG